MNHPIRARTPLVVAAFMLLALGAWIPPAFAQPRVLEDFEDISDWEVIASDGVECRVSPAARDGGGAMRVAYDFSAGAGFCIVRKRVDLPLDPNYRLSLDVRGDAPANDLELKLVSPTGDDVWWVNRRGYAPPGVWTRLAQKRRHFEFAWGPSGGDPLAVIGWIEFAIAASEGGAGEIFLDELLYEPLPEREPRPVDPRVRVGVGDSGSDVEGDGALPWRAAPGDPSWIEFRFDSPVEINAVELGWDPAHTPANYELILELPGGGTDTRRVEGGAGPHAFYTPETEIEAVRVRMPPTSELGAALESVHFCPIDEAVDPNDFLARRAATGPRGSFPRYFAGEHTPWTVVGLPGDDDEALVTADGAVELRKGGFTIEPFLLAEDADITWADAEISRSLEDDSLPIPTVRWDVDDLVLETTAVGTGEPGAAVLLVRYRVTNTGTAPRQVGLALAARPFQALPPWQRLNIVGGFSPVHAAHARVDSITINEHGRVMALSPADAAAAAAVDTDAILPRLRAAEGTMETAASSQGFACAAIRYDLDLAPAQSREVVIATSIAERESAPPETSGLDFDATIERERRRWAALLDAPRLDLPEPAAELARAARTTLAHILVNQDGPAIQPGSRTYERSWIRDGSITSLALIASGHADRARAFVDWYAPYQYDSGKVPCVVDHRGPDPVDEHDSTGQLIFVVWQTYLATGDRAFLERHFPRVRRGVEYLRALRARRLTPEYTGSPDPLQRAKAGLVPESISHEGYSAKPMHSYWDDFFVLRGLRDAASIAGELGDSDLEREYAALAGEFRDSLYDSIRLAAETHGIGYVPGCVELGDFDATSTSIAVFPGDNLGSSIDPLLRSTFDRYWAHFEARRDDQIEWRDFTPYEFRLAGAFVRLGEPERARALLDWLVRYRSPAAWNQWPEVAYRDMATPGFVGDIPHTWVGSAFILSLHALFAFERGDTLVIAPGVDPEWIRSEEGVGVERLATRWGVLAYSYRGDGDRAVLTIRSAPEAPGGLIVGPPAGGSYSALVDGLPTPLEKGATITLSAEPHVVVFSPVNRPAPGAP